MSSTKPAELGTTPGVGLQVANDFSTDGPPQPVTDPNGNASALQLSETAVGIDIVPKFPLHVGFNDSVRFELGESAQFSMGGAGVVNVDAPSVVGGRFTIQNDDTNNGNVGIGQPNPQYKLDVTGTIHATAGIVIQGLSPTSKAPSGANLVQLYIDTNSGEFYYQS